MLRRPPPSFSPNTCPCRQRRDVGGVPVLPFRRKGSSYPSHRPVVDGTGRGGGRSEHFVVESESEFRRRPEMGGFSVGTRGERNPTGLPGSPGPVRPWRGTRGDTVLSGSDREVQSRVSRGGGDPLRRGRTPDVPGILAGGRWCGVTDDHVDNRTDPAWCPINPEHLVHVSRCVGRRGVGCSFVQGVSLHVPWKASGSLTVLCRPGTFPSGTSRDVGSRHSSRGGVGRLQGRTWSRDTTGPGPV